MTTFLGITCRYINKCNNNADTLIISGCYQEHLSELAVCLSCRSKWEYLYHQNTILCLCGLTAKAYATLPLADATQDYRLQYIRGTNQNIRQPYVYVSTGQ